MKSIKRMVLTGAAVMVMMSFAIPATASVCQPTDTDCVEPPASDSEFPGPNIVLDPAVTTDVVTPVPQEDDRIDYGGCVCNPPDEVIH
jgi:hypothetical protein